MLESGTDICLCKRKKCSRHGNCMACIEHHANKKTPPYCKREKRQRIRKKGIADA